MLGGKGCGTRRWRGREREGSRWKILMGLEN